MTHNFHPCCTYGADLWRFDEELQEWTLVEVAPSESGAFPSPRSEHACALVTIPSAKSKGASTDAPDSEALLIVGGTDGSRILGDAFLLRLDADVMHWEQIASAPSSKSSATQTSPACPPAATGMSALFLADEKASSGRVVIVGGRTEAGTPAPGLCLLELGLLHCWPFDKFIGLSSATKSWRHVDVEGLFRPAYGPCSSPWI